MTFIEFFKQQLEEEAVTTRKMLSVIPDDKYNWKPHEKSMDIRSLATHIADLPTWITMALTSDELDFATFAYNPPAINTTKQLMDYFETCLQNGRTHLVAENENILDQPWTLRNGTTVYSTTSKREVIRMALSQIIHHRAQMGVFLRLLDVPIPGSYGPSADEPTF